MWFLLFSLGAILLGAVGLPAAARLPAAPPPEGLLACYFLVVTLLRLLVRDARLRAFERKARREARRKGDLEGSALGELGLGVGKGALQAVGGDILGAGLSLATALLRGAVSSLSPPPSPQRERRRAARWEQARAVVSIAGVGLVCVAVAWEPLVHGRLARASTAAAQAAGLGGGADPRAQASPLVRAALAPSPLPTSPPAPITPPLPTPTPASAEVPPLAPAPEATLTPSPPAPPTPEAPSPTSLEPSLPAPPP
jgi:hypothetical protein